MSKEKETKVVDITEAQKATEEPVDNQEDKAPEQETVQEPEVKHTFFATWDQKILERRAARAKKKAEKKPMNKGTKAAIIGGGIALGVGVLGAAGKAMLNAAARYTDDDAETDDEPGVCGYPTEDEPEEPAEVEAKQETTEETKEET